ncbi:MAG: hypothetical protein ACTSRA_03260, partial [Promethearchaeota archaeon]
MPLSVPSKGVISTTIWSPFTKFDEANVLLVSPEIKAPFLNQRYVYPSGSPSASLHPDATAVNVEVVYAGDGVMFAPDIDGALFWIITAVEFTAEPTSEPSKGVIST